MSRRRTTSCSNIKRYRVHFRELGYYQAVVEATNPQQAVRMVQDSPPELTFIATEEREVFAIDELRKNRTWKELPDAID